MSLIVPGVVIAALLAVGVGIFAVRRARIKREIAERSISPDQLHEALEKDPKPVIYDVRQPLDLLAYSEIIPGAIRLAPKEVLANPNLIQQDKDAVVYCTCPGDETSRSILEKTKHMNITRVRLLTGGLAAWKAKGYPVEPYTTAFRLDTATGEEVAG